MGFVKAKQIHSSYKVIGVIMSKVIGVIMSYFIKAVGSFLPCFLFLFNHSVLAQQQTLTGNVVLPSGVANGDIQTDIIDIWNINASDLKIEKKLPIKKEASSFGGREAILNRSVVNIPNDEVITHQENQSTGLESDSIWNINAHNISEQILDDEKTTATKEYELNSGDRRIGNSENNSWGINLDSIESDIDAWEHEQAIIKEHEREIALFEKVQEEERQAALAEQRRTQQAAVAQRQSDLLASRYNSDLNNCSNEWEQDEVEARSTTSGFFGLLGAVLPTEYANALDTVTPYAEVATDLLQSMSNNKRNAVVYCMRQIGHEMK